METDRNTCEGDPNDATEVTGQTASAMPPSDKELAINVITTYLLAQSKEFRQLSQLRKQVSFYISLYFIRWHVANDTTRDGRIPRATNFSPTSVPVQTLHTRALRSKQSRAPMPSSR
jgi:hypothetical protein